MSLDLGLGRRLVDFEEQVSCALISVCLHDCGWCFEEFCPGTFPFSPLVLAPAPTFPCLEGLCC
jgi:hypothetical protein